MENGVQCKKSSIDYGVKVDDRKQKKKESLKKIERFQTEILQKKC